MSRVADGGCCHVARSSTLVLTADSAAPAVARAVIGSELKRQRWDGPDEKSVLIALTEAVANAVRHGSRDAAPITIDYRVSPAHATLAIADTGSGHGRPDIGPVRVPPPTWQHGRGRLLMSHLADRVLMRPNASGLTVSLSFSRAGG